jgi:hypothetical protein
MELFELKEVIEETEADRRSWERKVQRYREELEPKAVDITKEKVSGGGIGKTIDDVMHLIIEAEKGVQRCKNLLEDYYQEVREKEEIYQKYNDRDKQIYIDKMLYKLNTAQMEIKYGLSKRQVNRIIKKIKKS